MKALTKANENYLEAILLLGGDSCGVKSVKIAEALGVSKPAVTLATGNLLELGLIEKASYGAVRLTERGAHIAREVLEKHSFLKNFLLSVGVSEKTAEAECMKMEHYLSDETVECLKKFCAAHDVNIWFENNPD